MTPTSKKFFAVSKTEIPNKLKKFYVKVTAKTLNVRSWADADSRPCSFSPVRKGAMLAVCDAILAPDKKPWYYIKYNGLYGFVNAAYVDRLDRDRVIMLLQKYSKYIKTNARFFHRAYDGDLTTFAKAKRLVEAKKKVGITCVVPLRWALAEMGLKTSHGQSMISGVDGHFKDYYSGSIKTHLTRITAGEVIGKTVRQAVDGGLLKKGDIICYKNHTHTSIYSGSGYYFYEGGSQCAKINYATGIKMDYKNYSYKISEILRWKG